MQIRHNLITIACIYHAKPILLDLHMNIHTILPRSIPYHAKREYTKSRVSMRLCDNYTLRLELMANFQREIIYESPGLFLVQFWVAAPALVRASHLSAAANARQCHADHRTSPAGILPPLCLHVHGFLHGCHYSAIRFVTTTHLTVFLQLNAAKFIAASPQTFASKRATLVLGEELTVHSSALWQRAQPQCDGSSPT